MTLAALAPAAPRPALWIRLLAGFGVLWSLYGVSQFLGTVSASNSTLMARGMTPEQAELYLNLPIWMNGVFAVGVFGGVLGSVLLFAGRRRGALWVLAASLIGYVALFLGDLFLGVFAALGVLQVAVLSFVVLIAAALLVAALRLPRAEV